MKKLVALCKDKWHKKCYISLNNVDEIAEIFEGGFWLVELMKHFLLTFNIKMPEIIFFLLCDLIIEQ